MLIKDPPIEISPNLLMLGTNAYPLFLFKGRSAGVIFEGGTGAMGPLLIEQMERLGIGKDFIKQVIITHAHPDHVMAVPLLQRMFPGITVSASEAAAKTLGAEKAISFFCQVDDALTSWLVKEGLITEKHRPPSFGAKQITVDRFIKEGDVIKVDDGGYFTVLETPGHSECSLSFHEPVQKILIISDATGYYMPQDNYWWPNYFVDYGGYLRSMERLAGLGAEILCLSHNGAIKGAEDIRSYFRRAIGATKKYHNRIVAEAKAGKSPRQTAEELGSEVYERVQSLPLEFFQKNCGILVKQSLRHEGISADK